MSATLSFHISKVLKRMSLLSSTAWWGAARSNLQDLPREVARPPASRAEMRHAAASEAIEAQLSAERQTRSWLVMLERRRLYWQMRAFFAVGNRPCWKARTDQPTFFGGVPKIMCTRVGDSGSCKQLSLQITKITYQVYALPIVSEFYI